MTYDDFAIRQAVIITAILFYLAGFAYGRYPAAVKAQWHATITYIHNHVR